MASRLSGFSFILLALLSSCSDNKSVISDFNGFAQGTTYSIVYLHRGNIEPSVLKAEVEEILKNFDMSLSLYQDSSVLSRINRNEEVTPDTFFTEAFRKSEVIYELTGGAFDVTVGPLVKAWGFGPDEQKNFSETSRDSLMQLVGMGKVRLVNNRIIKDLPGIMLDFNAIAQGYSVDVISRYFESRGLTDYLVEIGGEVRVRGDKAGNPWRIGIDRPVDNNLTPGNDLQAIIRLKDRSLATSGNYRKFYVENGVKYSHTIDPKTGYPAKNQLLSATIIAGDCATADGIATACMVMGKERAIDFITSENRFEAYFIYSDDKGNFLTWMTENLKDIITE